MRAKSKSWAGTRLLRYSFSMLHSPVKLKCGGETANKLFSWSKKLAQRPTYWSTDFSLNKYLSFTPPKIHSAQKHSTAIGGYTLHTTYTIVATHLRQEWDLRSPASNQSLLSCVSNCLISFINYVEYCVYFDFTSKSGTSPFNTSIWQNKYCGNYITGHNHIVDFFYKHAKYLNVFLLFDGP